MASVTLHVDPAILREFVAELFLREGLPAHAAQQVSDSLVAANLRGIDSHGVTRVPIYLARLRKGVIKKRPEIRVESRTASVSVIDGDNGMGGVVGKAAVEEAIGLARNSGIGAVGVRNSNHYGTAGHYLFDIVREGQIGLTVTNAPPTMVAFGGRDPFFGTNPWAIAAPAGRYPPVLLDMAPSVVARGKILLAEQRGQAIPEGWALDPEGLATTNPTAALVGAVLPFAGYKGSALAMFADVLSGVLTGAAFAPAVKDLYRNFEGPQNVGHFFLALDVASFIPFPAFERRMEKLVEAMKSGQLAVGHEEILMPGEPEALMERKRRRSGIPLTQEIVSSLAREAEVAGVHLPELSQDPLDLEI